MFVKIIRNYPAPLGSDDRNQAKRELIGKYVQTELAPHCISVYLVHYKGFKFYYHRGELELPCLEQHSNNEHPYLICTLPSADQSWEFVT